MQQLDLGKNLEVHNKDIGEVADDWVDLEGHNVFPPVAVSSNGEHMEVYGFFFQSLLKRKLWDPVTEFPSGRTGWENVNATSYLPAGIAAHIGDVPFVDVVYVDEQFSLRSCSVSKKEWSENHVDLELQSTDIPLALALPDKRLAVFARDAASGTLCMRHRTDSDSWANWVIVGTNDEEEPVPFTPSGFALPDGTIFLFGKSGNGVLSYRKSSRDFKEWSPWAELAHDSDVAPAIAATPDGAFVLALRDNDGIVHVAEFDAASESFSWHHVDGPFATAPGVAVTPQRDIWLFASDVSNNLLHNTYRASSKEWSGWSRVQFPNHVIFPPTVITRGDNVELFVVQAKSEVRHSTFN